MSRSPFRRRFALAIALAAMPLALIVAPASAGSSQWSGPQQISIRDVTQPSMTVDTYLHTHIVARGTDGIFYLTDANGSWRTHRLTTDSHVGSVRTWADQPVVFVQRGYNLMVVAYVVHTVDDSVSGPCDAALILLTRRHHEPWSTPIVVPGSPSCAGAPSISAWFAVTIGVAVEDLSGPASRLVYLTNASGDWTSQAVAPSGTHAATIIGAPSLVFTSKGLPRLTYVRQANAAAPRIVYYGRGTTTLGDFVSTEIAGTSGDTSTPSLDLSTQQRPRFVYSAADGTHFVSHKGDGWHWNLVQDGTVDSDLVLQGRVFAFVVSVDEANGLEFGWTRTKLDAHPVQALAGIGEGQDGNLHVVYLRDGHLWVTYTTGR